MFKYSIIQTDHVCVDFNYIPQIGALRFAQRVKYLKIFQVTHKKPDCADTTRFFTSD